VTASGTRAPLRWAGCRSNPVDGLAFDDLARLTGDPLQRIAAAA